jgi:hypothetical protein
MADAHPGRARDRPALGFKRAGQQAQQRALAGAVGADQRRPLARAERQRQAVEERRAVVVGVKIECLEHESSGRSRPEDWRDSEAGASARTGVVATARTARAQSRRPV